MCTWNFSNFFFFIYCFLSCPSSFCFVFIVVYLHRIWICLSTQLLQSCISLRINKVVIVTTRWWRDAVFVSVPVERSPLVQALKAPHFSQKVQRQRWMWMDMNICVYFIRKEDGSVCAGFFSAGCCFPSLCTGRASAAARLDLSFSYIRHANWQKQAFFEYATERELVSGCVCARVCLYSHVLLLRFLFTEFEVMDYLSPSLIQQGKSLWQTPSSFRFSLSWKKVVLQSLFWTWDVYHVAHWKYRNSYCHFVVIS